MKIIFCNTYYQVISAIQMKLTIFKNIPCDLIISNHSENSDLVVSGLRNTGLFSNVAHISTLDSDRDSRPFAKISRLYRMIVSDIEQEVRYDEIIFYNIDEYLYRFVVGQKKYSDNVICSAFDEGVLSTGHIASGKTPVVANKFRKILHSSQFGPVARYYCYFPELYRSDIPRCSAYRIPGWCETQRKLSAILCRAFKFDPIMLKQKYIYFCSSSDIDGFSYGETDLVKRLADKVGKDNLLVKMHPRDSRRVFQDYGITVMENSHIPWEAMQICGAAAGKVLITSTSGSFLSSTAMLADATRGIFLLPPSSFLTPMAQSYVSRICDTVEALHSSGYCENISLSKNADLGILDV